MNRILILLMFTLGMPGCTDPTRVITNKPKSADKKLQEKEQRRHEDQAATEALKSFRVSDHAAHKSVSTNPKQARPTNVSESPSKSPSVKDGESTKSQTQTPTQTK